MDVRSIFSDQKQIIAAVVAGIFAITAAYIRRDKRADQSKAKIPVLRLLGFPLFYLIVGAGLLAVEFFYVNVNADGDLGLDNPGAILCLAGCVFVVAAVVWLPLNVVRLLAWPRPQEMTGGSLPIQTAAVDSVSLMPTPAKKAKRGK